MIGSLLCTEGSWMSNCSDLWTRFFPQIGPDLQILNLKLCWYCFWNTIETMPPDRLHSPTLSYPSSINTISVFISFSNNHQTLLNVSRLTHNTNQKFKAHKNSGEWIMIMKNVTPIITRILFIYTRLLAIFAILHTQQNVNKVSHGHRFIRSYRQLPHLLKNESIIEH